ncbi:hypothetical protein CkaCkLH20_01655 [Colletotrichum karsti]|uniref:Uncharacterized protein n=1 Tax=Colletotrichum karsti TaxID=1095194 RepID=A0A9P6IBK9_9PEZI|nr:uncharacterized protein CkaCkLH20_01655 [Colletotrichum karsti]KAF9880613.1 hypothetical protein CkaCkLH20_01655 [Colletotrichum karsti]
MGDFKISTIPVYNPPGFPFQDDHLDAQQRTAWSNTISEWITNEIDAQYRDDDGNLQRLPGPCDGTFRTKLQQFFNGTVTPFNTGQKPALIDWIGFPKLIKIKVSGDIQRWKEADDHRDQQDEYCEWTVKRDDQKRIISVTFTCEGPEVRDKMHSTGTVTSCSLSAPAPIQYWAFLSQHDPQKMLELYKKNNPEYASQMKIEDMFVDVRGQQVYNPYNKWNGVIKTKPSSDKTLTTVNPGCIMHLAQRNNTLSAEIDIAAQGTVVRKDKQGNVITNDVKLCNCSKYGVATRNSDPKIGASINGLVRGGNSVSIADPVAIYMVDFDSSSFMLDQDGSGDNLIPVPDGTFTWQRGDINKKMGLRLHIQIPEGQIGTGEKQGRQLTVTDLVDTSNSQNVKYGAQFADYIHMGVNGVVIPNVPVAEPQACPCDTERNGNGHATGQPILFTMMAESTGNTAQKIPFKTRGDF